MIDRLFSFLFILALCLLAFIGGSLILHYKLPPSDFLVEAIDAGEAWVEKWQAMEEEPPVTGKNAEYAIANAKVNWDREKAYNGYTLITMRYSTTAWLLDMEGKVVHRWHMPFRKAWPNPKHVRRPVADARIYMERAHVFPNGDLLAIYEGWGDTPYGYGMVRLDKDSNVMWTYDDRVHHDLYIDRETGNILTLTQRFINRALPGLESLHYPMLADFIVTLSPEGKELESISLAEAFHGSPFELMLYRKPTSPLDWDHFHTNSIAKLEPEMADRFPLFKPGQLLVSIRNMNALAVIDPETKKVVWAYNGLWKAQHAAHFLPNGNILLLDNLGHVATEGKFSRIIEFNPATLQTAWSYGGNGKQRFYTYAYGRTQRLPNGNTLIASPLDSRVFEVTREGNVAWNYKLPEIFLRLAPDMPPYAKDIPPQRRNNPIFMEILSTDPNLLTAIVDATRYPTEKLDFLLSPE